MARAAAGRRDAGIGRRARDPPPGGVAIRRRSRIASTSSSPRATTTRSSATRERSSRRSLCGSARWVSSCSRLSRRSPGRSAGGLPSGAGGSGGRTGPRARPRAARRWSGPSSSTTPRLRRPRATRRRSAAATGRRRAPSSAVSASSFRLRRARGGARRRGSGSSWWRASPVSARARLADRLAPRRGQGREGARAAAAGRRAAPRLLALGAVPAAVRAETDPEGLRSQLERGRRTSPGSFPRSARPSGDLPEPPPLESEAARFRLFDSLSASSEVATARPLVLVLDDLHAADEPSLLLLSSSRASFGDAPPPHRRPHTATSTELVDPTRLGHGRARSRAG